MNTDRLTCVCEFAGACSLALSRFVAAVSQEIRAPLEGVAEMTQLPLVSHLDVKDGRAHPWAGIDAESALTGLPNDMQAPLEGRGWVDGPGLAALAACAAARWGEPGLTKPPYSSLPSRSSRAAHDSAGGRSLGSPSSGNWPARWEGMPDWRVGRKAARACGSGRAAGFGVGIKPEA